MLDDASYERLHERVAGLLADGPLPMGELIERLDAMGALDELRDDGVADETMTHALLDEVMLTELVWVSASDRVGLPAQLAEGLMLTHRLTAEEIERGEVLAVPDLSILDAGGDVDALELAGGGRLEYRVGLRAPGEDDSVVSGPEGWLRDFAPGDLVAFARRGSSVSVERAGEPAGDEREVELLRRAAAGRIPPGEGEEAYPLLLDAITDDPGSFRRPVRPASELLEAAGLERRGFSFGRKGEAWRTYAETAVERRAERAARRWGLDPCCMAALDEVNAAFAAEDASAEPAVVDALAHGAVAPAFVESLGPLQVERARGFADRLLEVARGAAAAPVLLVRALSLEAVGETIAAEAALRDALARDPSYGPAALELAGYEIDRGQLGRAATLLRHPELRTSASTIELLDELRAGQEERYRHVGRNDRCPCGSGRKFKACCQRQPVVELAARLPVLAFKLHRFVVGDEELRARVVGVASSACDPDDPDLVASLRAMADDPIMVDLVTFEGGAAEEYLDARGELLPADERELLERLLEEPRRLWEVTAVEPGRALTLRDTATGEVVDVVERSGSQHLEVGQLLLVRLARLGSENQLMGMPISVPLRLRASALELVDGYPGADAIAQWYGQALAMPPLVNRENEPFLLCHAELETGHALPALHAALDGVLEVDGDGWTDLWTAPDGDPVVRGTVRYEGGRLHVEANSEARQARLLETVLAAVPDAAVVVEEVTDPRRMVSPGRAAGPEDDVPPEALAAAEAYIRQKEAEWVDESIPALGGLTPRQALDDPTRREDLLALLRDLDARSVAGPGAGFDAGRLRALLGIDGR